jgi:hypothetical protein
MFINLYQATNIIGGGSASPASDFRGRIVNVDLREHREIVHITLDKSDVIHALVVDKVVGVSMAAARKQAALAMDAPPPARKPQPKNRKPQTAPPPAYVLPLTMRYVVPAKEPIVLFDSAISVTVKPDDTLETIAARTNSRAWVIGQVNKISDDAPLRPGQNVIVPQIVYSAAGQGAGR